MARSLRAGTASRRGESVPPIRPSIPDRCEILREHRLGDVNALSILHLVTGTRGRPF